MKNIFISIFLLTVIMFTSCGNVYDPDKTVSSLLKKLDLPPVTAGYSSAVEGENGYADEAFVGAVFGNGTSFPEALLCKSYAFFISSGDDKICEFGMFEVYKATDAGVIEDCLKRRCEKIARAAAGGLVGESDSNFKIITDGRYVAYAAGEMCDRILLAAGI